MPGIHGGGGRPGSVTHAPVVFRMVSKKRQPQTRTSLAHGGQPGSKNCDVDGKSQLTLYRLSDNVGVNQISSVLVSVLTTRR